MFKKKRKIDDKVTYSTTECEFLEGKRKYDLKIV